jgi:hypothetical protein
MFSSFFFTADVFRVIMLRIAKTDHILVIEQDQEIVRFNERLRQLRALSPDQRIKRILARLHELCHARGNKVAEG